MLLSVYRVPSRRLKTPVGIPWAEPAPVVAVPYPSWLEVKTNRIEFNQQIQTVELNVYPVNATNLPPAWQAKAANQSRYDIRLVPPPELVEFPTTPVQEQPLTSYLSPVQFKQKQARDFLQPLEQDEYPATPPVPEQPLTAFLEPKLFRRHQVRFERRTPEIDEYPESALKPKGFGVFSEIDDSGQGLRSAIDASGQGIRSLITPSLGVVSLMDNSGQGVVSLVNIDGKGVDSSI